MVVRYLTRDEIKTINKFLAIKYGFEHIVIKPGILDLCVETPKRSVYEQEMYPTKIEKAAALMSCLNKQHVFLHGNKRTAHSAASMFLELNGFLLSGDTVEAVDLSIRTACCTADTPEICDWMKESCMRSPWHPLL